MSRILHVGMHKSGTTSIQAALDQYQQDGLEIITRRDLAWDAAGCHPDASGLKLVEWDGDGSWARMCYGLMGQYDVVVSQEDISRARPKRVRQLANKFRPDLVIITWVPLSFAMPRYYTEMAKVGHTAPYEEWWGATEWRGALPDYDGVTVRPDVVATWWRNGSYADVKLVNAEHNAVERFFAAAGFGEPPVVPRLNARVVPFRDHGHAEAEKLILRALDTETIADLRGVA